MQMTHSPVVRRELPASHHIPYAAHVAPEVVVTRSGDYVQTFRVGGASFESEDDETLNNWHEWLNVTWRNIAPLLDATSLQGTNRPAKPLLTLPPAVVTVSRLRMCPKAAVECPLL